MRPDSVVGTTDIGIEPDGLDVQLRQDRPNEGPWNGSVRRMSSQMRISTEFVYGAAVPRNPSQIAVGADALRSQTSMNDEDVEDKPVSPPMKASNPYHAPHSGWLGLLFSSVGALGVIWGDIGTSPLYTYSSIYGCESECVKPELEDLKGTLSCVVWSLILIMFVKYLGVVMNCDFYGEGGIFALLQLIKTDCKKAMTDRSVSFFTTVAAIGASAMVADGLITPALSVLAAIEGIKDERIFGTSASPAVVPTTMVLLVALYALQFKGTTKVGRVFGPIMILYFLCIGGVGLYNIINTGNTSILAGWSPHHVYLFWTSGRFSGLKAFHTFGSIVLSVTGAEATYADLGHFGKPPVYISWVLLVFPALLLSYTGQACYALSNPDKISTLFFASIPNQLYIPVWIICTLATIIASQAMITGCYSIVSQGVTLGLVPRLKTINTDITQKAQIYIPSVTAFLAIGTLALVLAFRSSASLAGAYGIAVLITFVMSDMMLVGALYFVKTPKLSLFTVIVLMVPFFILDGTFLAANVYAKIAHGGWFPLIIAIFLTIAVLSWRYGRHATIKSYGQIRDKLDPNDYLRSIKSLVEAVKSGVIGTTPGTGVFLCPTAIEPLSDDGIPSTLALYLKVTGGLPKRTILLTVTFHKTAPFISQEDKRPPKEIVPGFHGFYSVPLDFGFAEPLSEVSLMKRISEVLPQLKFRDPDDAERAISDVPDVRAQSADSSNPGSIPKSNISYHENENMIKTESGKASDEPLLRKKSSLVVNGSVNDKALWFFLHSEDIEARPGRSLFGRVIVTIYSAMLTMSARASAFFGIPAQNVIQLGDVLQI